MFASKKNLVIVWNEVHLNKISSNWSLLILSCCILGFCDCLHAFVCLIIWTKNDKSFFLYLFFFFKSVGHHLRTLVKILVAGYIFNSPQSPKWSQLTWGTPLGELAPPSDQRNIFLWISIFFMSFIFGNHKRKAFFLNMKGMHCWHWINTESLDKNYLTLNEMTLKALWIVLYTKLNWRKMFEHVFWRGDESIFLTFDLASCILNLL